MSQGNRRYAAGFNYGVRFPDRRKARRWELFSDPAVEVINVDKEGNADILVLMPGEFDDSDEALVVIVNARCLRKDRLISELRHLTEATPDSPSARVYVPEKNPGHVHLGNMLQQRVNEASIVADVHSYYP